MNDYENGIDADHQVCRIILVSKGLAELHLEVVLLSSRDSLMEWMAPWTNPKSYPKSKPLEEAKSAEPR